MRSPSTHHRPASRTVALGAALVLFVDRALIVIPPQGLKPHATALAVARMGGRGPQTTPMDAGKANALQVLIDWRRGRMPGWNWIRELTSGSLASGRRILICPSASFADKNIFHQRQPQLRMRLERKARTGGHHRKAFRDVP